MEEGSVKMFLRGRPVPMLIPDELAPTYSLDTRSELPSSRLKLDWVYGYRGRDCRANLYLLPTGEIVYFVASVAVLYSVEEQRQRHYLGHNDDIKCLAVHPDMVTIATGQVAGTTKEGKPLPPHVRIWDSVSLSTLHVLGLGVFDRAVCCVGFSKSNGGNLLCAVDESNDHMLSVWDWAKEGKVVDGKCSNEAVLVATFHPTDPTLLITCGKSHIYFWSLEGGGLSKRQGLFEKHEKPKYVLCVTFLEGGDVITGDSGGNLYVWGKGGNRITQAVLGAHDGGVLGSAPCGTGRWCLEGAVIVGWSSGVPTTASCRRWRSRRTSAQCAPWRRAGETRCTWGPPATPSCRALSTRASHFSSRATWKSCGAWPHTPAGPSL